jgi:hypothetical protein
MISCKVTENDAVKRKKARNDTIACMTVHFSISVLIIRRMRPEKPVATNEVRPGRYSGKHAKTSEWT